MVLVCCFLFGRPFFAGVGRFATGGALRSTCTSSGLSSARCSIRMVHSASTCSKSNLSPLHSVLVNRRAVGDEEEPVELRQRRPCPLQADGEGWGCDSGPLCSKADISRSSNRVCRFGR